MKLSSLPAIMPATMNAADIYQACTLCPRRCGVNRKAGEKGFCSETDIMRVASACLHFGEEPVLTEAGGSGTIFFSGCTLRCSFCQNRQISGGGIGKEISVDEFSNICLVLEKAGAQNINLVTGTHFIPGIITGISNARDLGLTVPVLWNTSGFETCETLDLLSNTVQVYLPDIKTVSGLTSFQFFKTSEYPFFATKAVEWMCSRSAPAYRNGALTQGTIVRHLVLPRDMDGTRAVLEWYSRHVKNIALLSLMVQYLPMAEDNLGPRRSVSENEYGQLIDMLNEFDINDGFIQELDEESGWSPDFCRNNPFPADYATPVWHWQNGFSGQAGSQIYIGDL
jgi:putative pyruvate formate lyase activating enzyme